VSLLTGPSVFDFELNDSISLSDDALNLNFDFEIPTFPSQLQYPVAAYDEDEEEDEVEDEDDEEYDEDEDDWDDDDDDWD